ncbi:MAG: hypothetical protein IJK89_08365 [Clostridia bacterium]|nr:hypothetical protein [Clostridia bacterium]
MERINVFDARIEYGRPFLKPAPERTLAEEMRLADADEAVFVSRELFWLPPQRSIGIVNERTATTPGAWGVYLMLPAVAGETPPVETLAEGFAEHRIAGFTLGNDRYGVPYHPLMLKDELAACERLHIPLFYHRAGQLSFEFLCEIMEKHPALTVALSIDEEWPNARKLYPLMKAYEGIHLCLSEHVWMGAIEDLTAKFGASRLLYSSSHPRRYAGGTVLMVQNAAIPQEDKDLIFRGNLKRLIGGIGHD